MTSRASLNFSTCPIGCWCVHACPPNSRSHDKVYRCSTEIQNCRFGGREKSGKGGTSRKKALRWVNMWRGVLEEQAQSRAPPSPTVPSSLKTGSAGVCSPLAMTPWEGRLTWARAKSGGPNRPALSICPTSHMQDCLPPPHPEENPFSLVSLSLSVTGNHTLCLPPCGVGTCRELGRQGVQDALVPGQDAETQVVQQLVSLRLRPPSGQPRGGCQAPASPGEFKGLQLL